MSDVPIQGLAAAFGKEALPGWKPCAVVAVAQTPWQVTLQLRRLGWDVYEAGCGPQLRRLVRLLDADLAVIDAGLPGESGWLTSAKLREEWPQGRIVLLGQDGVRRRRMAVFVGADVLVPHEQAVPVAVAAEQARAA